MIYDAGLEYAIKKNNTKIKMLEALKTNIRNEVKNSGFTDEYNIEFNTSDTFRDTLYCRIPENRTVSINVESTNKTLEEFVCKRLQEYEDIIKCIFM